MKLRYTVLILFCLTLGALSAQTLDQARSMFTKGEYDAAKPVFERFVKSSPNNANYNYWYGVCCLETGEAEKSIPYLELAHKRKVQNAPLNLGKAYEQTYRFEEAVDAFQDYIDAQTKRKQPVDEVQAMQDKAKVLARMLKGVEDVCVIDSFVVDKANFLEAYRISEESGTLYTFNEFFRTSGDNPGTVYETELKNKVYYSEPGEDGTLNIMTRNKQLNEWSNGNPLPESINSGANANYPFMMTDGITIYFAADSANSIGGYDIFVTRYNTGTDSYLAPENVGMPFNSPFNDYMYAIDEFNNLGWFATDRYQPEDKVCIYVFIPNTSKVTYNFESMEPEQMRSLAQLRSIEDTWKDEDTVEEARENLQAALNRKPKEVKSYDFSFIINDEKTYHSFSDFRSPTALQQFRTFQQMEKDYKQQSERLKTMRDNYASASAAQQQQNAPAILDLEKRVRQMKKELNEQEIRTRNEEIQTLNK